MSDFEPLWKNKRLAIIHCAGSPDNTRSHFDAQDYMEAGTRVRKDERRMAQPRFAGARRKGGITVSFCFDDFAIAAFALRQSSFDRHD